MKTINAKQVAIAFTALTIVFTVFSSSIFYNSVEGPLVIACLLLMITVNKDILKYAKEVKMIFFMHLLFACSVLTTGMMLYTRQLVSLSEAISDASSILLSSFFGLGVYIAFRNVIVRHFLNYLILLFAAGLLIYCASFAESRVYDIQHRYVLNVGLLLCLLSLCMIINNRETTTVNLFLIIFVSSAALHIAFTAIQSRAMSIALLLAWLIALFTLRHKLIVRLTYLISPIVIILGIQSYGNFSEVNLQRYKALSKIIQVAFKHEESVYNDTSLIQSAEQPTTLTKPDIKISNANKINRTIDTPSNKNSRTQEETVLQDKPNEEIILKSDYSLESRYEMLVVGLEYANAALVFGHGNMGEADIMKNQFDAKHPNLHNQYLSLLISGGLVHLLVGGLFIAAPFISNNRKDCACNYRDTLPILSFIFCFLSFESLLQLTGWRNLLIIYGYVIAGVLHGKSLLR